MKLLSKVDFYKKDFSHKIQGGSFKNIVGGILSSILLCLYLLALGYFGKDLYYKEQPNVISETGFKESNEDSLVNMDKAMDSLIFMVSNPSDMEYSYLPTLKYSNQTISTDVSYLKEDFKVIPPVACDFEFGDLYTCFNYNSLFGRRSHKSEELMDGIKTNVTYTEIFNPTVTFEKCTDSYVKLFNGTCPPPETYNNLFINNTFYTSYSSIQQVALLRHFEKFTRRSFDYKAQMVQLKKQTVSIITTYQLVNVTSDDGLFWEQTRSDFYLQHLSSDVTLFPYISEADPLITVTIVLDRKYINIRRQYIRIPQIIAGASAIMRLIIDIIGRIYSFHLENCYITFMISKTFNLKCEELEPGKAEVIDSPNKETDVELVEQTKKFMSNTNLDYLVKEKSSNENNKLATKRVLTATKSTNEGSGRLNTLINQKKKKYKKVEITPAKRAKYYCCIGIKKFKARSTLKYELMLVAEFFLNERSEVFKLFKDMDQVRLLKKIVLNEEQCFMIDNRDLQNITTPGDLKDTQAVLRKEIKDLREAKYKARKEKLKEYISNRKGNLSKVDELLLHYLDSEVKYDLELDKDHLENVDITDSEKKN